MKRAIIFAVIFGLLSGFLRFVLETLCGVDNIIVESLGVTLFVVVGISLGIFTSDKKK